MGIPFPCLGHGLDRLQNLICSGMGRVGLEQLLIDLSHPSDGGIFEGRKPGSGRFKILLKSLGKGLEPLLEAIFVSHLRCEKKPCFSASMRRAI